MGVGRRLEKHLNAIGIRNAYELTQLDISYVRKRFNIVLAKTIRELKGEICIDLEDQPITKKQIVVSRTFSQRVTNQDLLNEAVSDYAARAGVKLRREKNKYVSCYQFLSERILFENKILSIDK